MSTLVLNQHRLGRLYAPDPRDRGYRLRAITDTTKPKRKQAWRFGPFRDQQATSECTRYMSVHRLEAAPLMRRDMLVATAAMYPWCVANDGLPGTLADGTTVRAAMQWLQAHRYISNYYWAWKLHEARAYLEHDGPVGFGIDWFAGMDTPDKRGVIHPTGAWLGGHAIICRWVYPAPNRISKTETMYRFVNSWGAAWGVGGECYIPEAELRYLLEESAGEAVAMVELRNAV